MVKVSEPKVIRNFFPEDRYKKIMGVIESLRKDEWSFQSGTSRYTLAEKWIDKLAIYELDRAREIFDNDKLLFTYALLSYYNNDQSNLYMHKDDNACTYTIDICLYSKEAWPLIIEEEEYVLNGNDAVCFYGEDQVHGRPEFKKGNNVLMLFLHYADRDHWWFQANNRECV
jgi:hypothetical protein